MSTRIISPQDLAATEAGSSRSRSQRPIDLEEIDGIAGQQGVGSATITVTGQDEGEESGGAGGQYGHIRPTTSSHSLPLPPLISNDRRLHRSTSPTTTTQQPGPSLSPPSLTLPDIQTPRRRRAANLLSTTAELPPISPQGNEPSGHHRQALENSLPSTNFDDSFLADLASGGFSSPSSYPLFANPDSQPSQSQTHRVSQASALQASISAPHLAAVNTVNTVNNAPRNPSAAHHCISNILGPERSTTQLSSSTNATGESQSTLPIFDSFDDNDIFFDSPASSFSDTMPPTLRRTTAAATPRTGSAPTNKRRRTSTAPANENATSTKAHTRQKKTSTAKKEVDVDELFCSSPLRNFVDLETNEEYDTVDLTGTNEIPEDTKTPEKDDRIKLAAFQCVICMDDCVNLTVTHCGHLYCASCLHQSLSVDATKGKCPMCRQKLDMKSRDSYNSKTKGYWPLELKLMTATRKGKRKANILS